MSLNLRSSGSHAVGQEDSRSNLDHAVITEKEYDYDESDDVTTSEPRLPRLADQQASGFEERQAGGQVGRSLLVSRSRCSCMYAYIHACIVPHQSSDNRR